ncbi:MAG TPA: hypothetical protein VMX95_11060 [Thermodesulfobacteriota bacterium]|nr:hypothetical protein [Thermodesulfobacteriota bacterium]
MIHVRSRLAFLLFIFALVIGCGGARKEIISPSSPLGEGKEATNTGMQQEESLTDEELFNLGLSYLSSPELSPDYPNAFLAFKRLTENYPESKRKDIAQHFTSLLEQYLKLSMENSRLYVENQELTQEKKILTEEKTRWEEDKDRLLKEITSLKSDLKYLKQIEIESEKREKNVR